MEQHQFFSTALKKGFSNLELLAFGAGWFFVVGWPVHCRTFKAALVFTQEMPAINSFLPKKCPQTLLHVLWHTKLLPFENHCSKNFSQNTTWISSNLGNILAEPILCMQTVLIGSQYHVKLFLKHFSEFYMLQIVMCFWSW